MRTLDQLKDVSFYNLTASEIEFLRTSQPAIYKEKTEAIDAEAAAKPVTKSGVFVNGVEIPVETVSFTNGRRNS